MAVIFDGDQHDLAPDPIVEAVVTDHRARSRLGLVRYRTTLADNPAPLPERLQHAYEEALDLPAYLKWAIGAAAQLEAERDELAVECDLLRLVGTNLLRAHRGELAWDSQCVVTALEILGREFEAMSVEGGA